VTNTFNGTQVVVKTARSLSLFFSKNSFILLGQSEANITLLGKVFSLLHTKNLNLQDVIET
jgi:hypothetical protein